MSVLSALPSSLSPPLCLDLCLSIEHGQKKQSVSACPSGTRRRARNSLSILRRHGISTNSEFPGVSLFSRCLLPAPVALRLAHADGKQQTLTNCNHIPAHTHKNSFLCRFRSPLSTTFALAEEKVARRWRLPLASSFSRSRFFCSSRWFRYVKFP